MRGKDEEQKKGEGRGFAGLSSLVSDVDMTPPPAAKTEPAATAPSTGRPSPLAAQPQPSQQHQAYPEPAQQASSGSSAGMWVVAITAVISVLWLIGLSDKSPTSPAPAYSPLAEIVTTSDSPSPAEPQAPTRPKESIPPVGQGLTLSVAQIRYCLAEDIRVEGARSVLDLEDEAATARFNDLIADFNSRCVNFNHGPTALDEAHRDIEPHRRTLRSEGIRRFIRGASV